MRAFLLYRLIDLGSLVIAATIFYFSSSVSLEPTQYALLTFYAVATQAYLFSILGVYKDRRSESFFKELRKLAIASFLLVSIIGTTLFTFKLGEEFSRLWVGSTFLLACILSIVSRYFVRKLNQHFFALGRRQKSVVIVGAEELGLALARRMHKMPWAGYMPQALFDDNIEPGMSDVGVPIVGKLDSIVAYIEQCRIDNSGDGRVVEEVWVTLPFSKSSEIDKLKLDLMNTAAKVRLVPHFHQIGLHNYDINMNLGIPVMNLSGETVDSVDSVVKRFIDTIISAALIVCLLPIFLLVALAIKAESKGSIFYRQQRYGLDGREFSMLKFRSMVSNNVIEECVVKQAVEGDARVTGVGVFLRKYSIDELPQLFNVFIGDMSLVGPRPHASSHNEYYRTRIAGYMARHSIKPGITGWAQVNGLRGETPQLSDMKERLDYDIEYIRNWSLSLDLSIMFRTVAVVLTAKGAY